MRLDRTLAPLALLVAAPLAGAQQRPPVRPLGAVVARSSETFGNVTAVRGLPGGRVYVNDPFGRRVLLLDSGLTSATIVADSLGTGGNSYGQRGTGLFAFRGDSTLLVDPGSLSMLVLDPGGKVTRVMSVPRSDDASALSGFLGVPGFDPAGRIVYRSPFRFRFNGPPPTIGAGALPPIPQQPDSAAIVRVDLATRKLDTVGFIRTPRVKMNVTQDDKGNVEMRSEVNPLPVVDDWAVLSDGTVLFVRGQDYHVDWVGPDGTRGSAAKIPFDWQRLTDEDKVAFLDSVKAARARMAASAPPAATGAAGAPPGGAGGSPAGGQMTIVMSGGPDGGAARGGAGPVRGAPQVSFVSPSELPDYKPPFFANSVRADADGNVWIRTIPTKAIAGGPVYDVVNRKGELVDRVQVPEGRTIVGFGPDGSVFLAAREGSAVHLERAKAR